MSSGIEECSPGRFAFAGLKRVVFRLIKEDDISIIYHGHLHGRDATRAYLLVRRGPYPWVLGSPGRDPMSAINTVSTDYGKSAEKKNE